MGHRQRRHFLTYLSVWLGRVLVAALGVVLCHGGSFVAACGLLTCSVWALWLWCRAQLPFAMWGLSSPTRDQTLVSCIARQILNH